MNLKGLRHRVLGVGLIGAMAICGGRAEAANLQKDRQLIHEAVQVAENTPWNPEQGFQKAYNRLNKVRLDIQGLPPSAQKNTIDVSLYQAQVKIMQKWENVGVRQTYLRDRATKALGALQQLIQWGGGNPGGPFPPGGPGGPGGFCTPSGSFLISNGDVPGNKNPAEMSCGTFQLPQDFTMNDAQWQCCSGRIRLTHPKSSQPANWPGCPSGKGVDWDNWDTYCD